jgi:OmcA/MtrC family decaheme c-type cytochrome
MAGMNRPRRLVAMLICGLLALAMGAACDSTPGPEGPEGPEGPTGPTGPTGPPGEDGVIDDGTSVEACIGCHGPEGAVPVVAINNVGDAHYIDTDPDRPETPSGYRQLNIDITSVEITGSTPGSKVIIEFDVTSEDAFEDVDDIFASDGRFTIAHLSQGTPAEASDDWQSLIVTVEGPGPPGPGTDPQPQATYERFTANGGVFTHVVDGSYRYESVFDPSTIPVITAQTLRVAIQLSAGDLPTGNGWCDFDVTVETPNACESLDQLNVTRDIVQTDTCNGCHGTTSDTWLALHGGGRTEVEYCVTCHNPGTIDANSGNTVDMKVFIHKIHRGASLPSVEGGQPYQIWGFRDSLHDYSYVNFTKDIDDCTTCHTGDGLDVDNWSTVPTMEACESCHDNIDIDEGIGHIQLFDNVLCTNCHPQAGDRAPNFFPIETMHVGVARADEGALYANGDGFLIQDVTLGPGNNDLTIDYSVSKDGMLMDLANDDEWNGIQGSSRLAITVGWDTGNYDYSNEGSGATPAQPVGVNGLTAGVETPAGSGIYRAVADISGASGTVTVAMEGHPAGDLDEDNVYSDRIAVLNAFEHVDIEGGRADVIDRRDVIDIDKCNTCHDSSGAGVSLHGNNRTGEMQVCVVCHNPDATDINQRPDDPADAKDGKVEEAIDMKRMLHQIHTGSELANGLVIYGFGGSEHDFDHVDFIGNTKNCETCHIDADAGGAAEESTYSADSAWQTMATTLSTGADLSDPSDDLNVSPTAAVCSSCHDDAVAKNHMLLNGGSFQALDDDIH